MMLGFWLRFAAGYDTVLCPPSEDGGKRHGALVGAIAARGLRVHRMYHDKDGALVLILPRRDTAGLCELASRFSLQLVARQGLPALAARYRRRVGIPVGALLFCALLFLFCGVLWRVDVTGADADTEVQIRETLADIGCKEGTWLGGLNLYAVGNALLCEMPTLSYASVVRDGMVLSVTVRPRIDAPPAVEQTPANLVAASDGVIISFTVAEGQPMVTVGQAVRAGELLVSGVVLHRDGSLSVVQAEGAVYAQTTCAASAEVLLVAEERTVAGRVVYGREIEIFGKVIKFYKSTGNTDTECGTIAEKRQLALFSRVLLPIHTKTLYEPVYRTEEKTRTPAEAIRLATAQALADLHTKLGAAEVLATHTVVEEVLGGYRVTCTADVRMNIAVQQPFTANP